MLEIGHIPVPNFERFVEELEEFFFEGMLAGYTGDAPREQCVQVTGWKEIEHVSGPLKLRDQWGRDDGRTLIFYNEVLVWAMIYAGCYPEEAIPLLKAALAERYKAHQFYGGRGGYLRQGDLQYRNHWTGSFYKFDFTETITPYSGPHSALAIGVHKGAGTILIPPPAEK